nr:hypothetical protein CFP56_48619 [Quercus suber]
MPTCPRNSLTDTSSHPAGLTSPFSTLHPLHASFPTPISSPHPSPSAPSFFTNSDLSPMVTDAPLSKANLTPPFITPSQTNTFMAKPFSSNSLPLLSNSHLTHNPTPPSLSSPKLPSRPQPDHGEQPPLSNPATSGGGPGNTFLQPQHPGLLGVPLPWPYEISGESFTLVDSSLPEQLLESHRGRDGSYSQNTSPHSPPEHHLWMCDNSDISKHGVRFTSGPFSPKQPNTLDDSSEDLQTEWCRSPRKLTHLSLPSKHYTSPHVHKGTGLAYSLHGPAPSHLLQASHQPHPHHSDNLQNHPHTLSTDLDHSTSFCMEVWNISCIQPLQPSPNEDTHLEL